MYPARLAVGGQDIEPGRLQRCLDCSLGQRVPCPDDNSLAAVYRVTTADAMDYAFEDNIAWCRARDYLRQRWPSTTAEPAVLDVGCHTGLFLSGLPERWRRFGIESALDPRRIAVERHRIELIAERLESIPGAWHEQFDVVTLFDVFEHLVRPCEGLAKAAQLLRPGGVLIISTGDMDAWTWKVAAGRHWYLQTPLHLSFGSRRFFAHYTPSDRLRLHRMMRIAHRAGGLRSKGRQAIELIYWELRQRGGWYRIPQRALQSIPGLRYLKHKQSVPWTMTLRDHVLVMYERS